MAEVAVAAAALPRSRRAAPLPRRSSKRPPRPSPRRPVHTSDRHRRSLRPRRFAPLSSPRAVHGGGLRWSCASSPGSPDSARCKRASRPAAARISLPKRPVGLGQPTKRGRPSAPRRTKRPPSPSLPPRKGSSKRAAAVRACVSSTLPGCKAPVPPVEVEIVVDAPSEAEFKRRSVVVARGVARAAFVNEGLPVKGLATRPPAKLSATLPMSSAMRNARVASMPLHLEVRPADQWATAGGAAPDMLRQAISRPLNAHEQRLASAAIVAGNRHSSVTCS